MKWRLLITSSILLALIIAGGLAFDRRQREPVYQGKTVTEWIRDYWINSQGGTNHIVAVSGGRLSMIGNSPARDTLRKLGPAAIPAMLAALRKDQGVLASGYERVYQKLDPSWQRSLPRPAPLNLMQANAKFAFGELHDVMRPAIPKLIELLANKDPSVHAAVTEVLSQMRFNSESYADSWNRLLASPLSNRYAVEVIGKFISSRTPAVKAALLKALEDPDVEVRAEALDLLARDSEQTVNSIAAIGGRLHDPDPRIRGRAIELLGYFTEYDKTALPDLVYATHDSDPAVQAAAKTILKALENQSSATVLTKP